MLNLSTNTPKNQLHQTFQISKIFSYCYSEIVLIQPHCSTNLKSKIIFYSNGNCACICFFYFSLLSSLSSLTFLFSLSRSFFVSLGFMVWAPPLQGSLVRNFKAQMPSECCRRYGGRAWQRGDLILWVVNLWFRIVIGVGRLWVCDFGLWSAWVWVSGLWVCDFELWLAWAWVSRLWICDFRLWLAWVSGLWVWVVVGRSAVDQYDGFALLEVCCGGFVCVYVCVCVFCSPTLWVYLSIFLLSSRHLDFVIVMVVDLWFGRGR